jgi:hypothetical protein
LSTSTTSSQRAYTACYHLLCPLWPHPPPKKINKSSMLTLDSPFLIGKSLVLPSHVDQMLTLVHTPSLLVYKAYHENLPF